MFLRVDGMLVGGGRVAGGGGEMISRRVGDVEGILWRAYEE